MTPHLPALRRAIKGARVKNVPARMRSVKRSILALWLLLLPFVGQYAAQLHHFGHDVAELARVAAHAAAVNPGQAAVPETPGGDGHTGVCLLCVGFGAATASAPPAPGVHVPEAVLRFARPLTEASLPRLFSVAGTPIRGPPASFSPPA